MATVDVVDGNTANMQKSRDHGRPGSDDQQPPGFPDAPRPLYLQIADVLRDGIASGKYPAGSRLPSETDIAQITGAARATIRKAFRVLAEEGVAVTIPARGSYVLPID